jgi:hypothetical protein
MQHPLDLEGHHWTQESIPIRSSSEEGGDRGPSEDDDDEKRLRAGSIGGNFHGLHGSNES